MECYVITLTCGLNYTKTFLVIGTDIENAMKKAKERYIKKYQSEKDRLVGNNPIISSVNSIHKYDEIVE